MDTQYKAIKIKKTDKTADWIFKQVSWWRPHLLNFFSLATDLEGSPKSLVARLLSCDKFFIWNKLVSISTDVRMTCADRTKYKAIKRIHSFHLHSLPPEKKNKKKSQNWRWHSNKLIMVPTSQIPVPLADATIAAHFFWNTGNFYSTVTRIKMKINCSCKYRCSKNTLRIEATLEVYVK